VNKKGSVESSSTGLFFPRGKKGLDYAVSMMIVVIIVMPILLLQMNSKITESGKIGDAQIIMLRTPYVKEDIVNYLQKSAEVSLAEITKACAPGSIVTLTKKFNQEMDKYISEFNAKSPITKIPTNNYELYIDGKNINAIAMLPVEKKLSSPGTELDAIGRMWFAPSFTITAPTDLSSCPL